MTVRQGVKRMILKKTVFLICIAVILFILFLVAKPGHSSPEKYSNLIYTLATLGISLLVLLFIAWKIRYFHNLFSKEFTGTVVDTKYERFGNYAITSIKNVNNFAIKVQLDNSKDIVELRFSMNKISEKVYKAGDRIHRIKGTRYPINLTREAEQHICPICGWDSCLSDECPNCKIKY